MYIQITLTYIQVHYKHSEPSETSKVELCAKLV